MHCSRLGLLAASLLTSVALTGCLDHPLKEVEYENMGVGSGIVQIPRGKVDVLFVIDDSGSMGEEQAALAANFATFVAQLEREDVDADYRIGITTTNNGNPWCGDPNVDVGALQLRSCHAHLDDFVFSPGTAQEIDRREEACVQHCPAELAELTTLPTATTRDPNERARPWLQRGGEGTNVPQGVSTAEALACWGPQGISGCGFESPLEAMWRALGGEHGEGGDLEGFLRDDALLQVVIVTDEADCSLGPAGFEAFDYDGNGTRTLWPDPSASIPSNALCWNAGVSCQTGADGLTHCDPVDLDAEGQPTGDDGAVLHSLDRYLALLGDIDRRKRERTGDDQSQVFVSVIAGVPVGYDGSDLDYDLGTGPGTDPEFFDKFGVGPGCSSDNGEAVPPVRLRALADAFAQDVGSNLFSICDGDYSPALEAISDVLIPRLRPSCIDECVVGADTIVDGELSSCVVVEEIEGRSHRVPTCLRSSDGEWVRPEGEDLCVYAVAGEERNEACAEGNVELRFRRAPGSAQGEVSATCELSDLPSVDCA